MVMKQFIVGIYSSQPQSGKSTVAGILKAKGWVVVPFAGTLKRMTRALLSDLGFDDDRIDELLSSEKGLPLEGLDGMTPRRMMQTLGTDWGRECVHSDVWLRSWTAQVKRLGPNARIVVDDVRFSNEAKLIKSLGGRIMKISRDVETADEVLSHASEGSLDDWPFDYYLDNNRTIRHLEVPVAEMVGWYFDIQ